ncbi:MAG: 3-methyl-2-oxobutanoate dehydrogenase subunit VorB [Planctomycetes bacterium]|nr:3-methyl-2-oxobutanoate dehydrogenase subunit VorB [Planctomycetota bacterium]MBU1517649.1 3-methyl-2-oxobutanoate dehydrogenase subunit VorB [Planctomycetota bacterium]MBU2457170.1 3-methyl-2-oxobutanoate dehydrogenase subunit VorB [Planctomycetota bacterium]MBU2597401.1 3-methyl-2-oxobutanoate dehydrogenase subunit VorB [Planctomycetota bacterium]
MAENNDTGSDTKRVLMKGNEAVGEAAIKAGCLCYFAYPITPQTETPEYLAKRMEQENLIFLQAESEVAAINMVFGASAAGARVMTSSSSPGISLKQEGISYIAGGELPCVIINVVRGGPGLGNIEAAQADYFQSTRGGGHGDYRCIVLAPNSVQECYDMVMNAFDLADFYRVPVIIQSDGIIGQLVEPFDMHPYKPMFEKLPPKTWALTGCAGRKPNVVRTLYLNPANGLEMHNRKLEERYKKIHSELRWSETYNCDDADIIVIAYGATSRIAKSAIKKHNTNGVKVGLFRLKTLWPWPDVELVEIAKKNKDVKFLVIEMSMGQMLEDVQLSLMDVVPKKDILFYGMGGGWNPTPDGVYEKISEIINK